MVGSFVRSFVWFLRRFCGRVCVSIVECVADYVIYLILPVTVIYYTDSCYHRTSSDHHLEWKMSHERPEKKEVESFVCVYEVDADNATVEAQFAVTFGFVSFYLVDRTLYSQFLVWYFKVARINNAAHVFGSKEKNV